MNHELPIVFILLLIICGVIQIFLSKCFENQSSKYERLFTLCSGYVCLGGAVISVIVNFFV